MVNGFHLHPFRSIPCKITASKEGNMKRLNQFSLFFILHFSLCTLTLAAQENPVLGAMRAELSRSMAQLKLEGREKPYFISYRVTDHASVTVEASLGSVTESSESCFRNLIADVRVGSYKLDNSGVERSRGDFNEEDWRYRNVRVPVEDDTLGLKQKLWLATDQAYKRALEDYGNKKKGIALNPDPEERPADFSVEQPVVSIGDEARLAVDKKAWQDRLKRYSLVFKDYQGIFLSRVRFDASAQTKYFVTSEGSKIQDGEVIYTIGIGAETRSADGMPLRDYRELSSYTGVWSDELVEREIHGMAERLTKLREAKACDSYAGPVLMQAPASAVFVGAVIAPLLKGDKRSWKDEEGLQNKIGERILPASVSIYDDPTMKDYQGEVLTGFYRFDEDGVPGSKVNLIEAGVLKNFLLSRSPVKGFNKSNGHGRADLWGRPRPDVGNLIIESSAAVSMAELKNQLISECKTQGKSYGLLITSLLYPTGVEVYKIYTDGKEELVRGVEVVAGSPLAMLGKIVAFGNDPKATAVSLGTVAAPSILLSELEIRKTKKGMHPPLLPPPGE
jgi:predicted Zn-dependent protease